MRVSYCHSYPRVYSSERHTGNGIRTILFDRGAAGFFPIWDYVGTRVSTLQVFILMCPDSKTYHTFLSKNRLNNIKC